ncbi:2-oxo acid dehydrogenase subunit E2 [Streptosporangium sp. NPDC049644]|uniref:2-oxo acid dehydrogenase subunit E2 n=1 Tax=Streptosporangium sp. NPDC049644 TaxID=3155507 RepID=UPI0034228DC6
MPGPRRAAARRRDDRGDHHRHQPGRPGGSKRFTASSTHRRWPSSASARSWSVPGPSAGCSASAPLVTVTLAADHRATDGYVGARFLTAVDRLLSHPEAL